MAPLISEVNGTNCINKMSQHYIKFLQKHLKSCIQVNKKIVEYKYLMPEPKIESMTSILSIYIWHINYECSKSRAH